MKYKDIPEYLRASEFYLNLDPLGAEFDIPFDIPEEIINNMEDFTKMYKIINFFGAKYPDLMKSYWVNNSFEIMKKYLDFSSENREMFEQFISYEINNFQQFESIYKLIGFYNFFPSDNYVEYGLKNKNEYIGKNTNSLSEELKNTNQIEIKWEIHYNLRYSNLYFYIYFKSNGFLFSKKIEERFISLKDLDEIIDDYEIIIHYLKHKNFSEDLDRGPINILKKNVCFENSLFDNNNERYSFELKITDFNSKIISKYLLDMFSEILEKLNYLKKEKYNS
uniref:Uncharacterized protein n=1 Tax=viral metagenome TaxID=1070528 RepID=A0A6C0AEV0_9ZZZZ